MPDSTLITLADGSGVTCERNVLYETNDGTTLYSDIYRPATDELVPAIIIRIPYDKTQALNLTYAQPAWYARQGYVVITQDVRGRHESEGEWYPFRHETDDGAEVIEWAAHLAGVNGLVGMYGFSYGGATQLLPARKRPAGLAAICPAMTASQYYEGWTYNGGALALGFVASWALSLGPNTALRRGDVSAAANLSAAFANALSWHWALPLDAYPPLQGQDTAYFFDWLAHPTYDDYWRQWSIDEAYDEIDVPALHVAGWYDVFLDGTIKNFNGLRSRGHSKETRERQKLVIGPWYHIPWEPLAGAPPDAASPNRVDELQVRWFDHILKGKNNGVLDDPVEVLAIGEQQWRSFSAWPPVESQSQRWYLHSDGRANSRFGDGALSTVEPALEPADLYTYDPAIPVLSTGGHSCCFPFVAPMGPADQATLERWNQVLVYTSEPLQDDLVLIGDVEAVLYAASSCVDTDWAVRLHKVASDGVSINVQEGILRARYRDSLTDPTPLEPNEIHEFRIWLGAVGVRLQAGEQIRVVVSSSDFPQWDRNMNSGGPLGTETALDARVATQIVRHDAAHPSHVVLPVLREDAR